MKQYSSVVARDLSFTYDKRYIEDNKVVCECKRCKCLAKIKL